MNSTEGEKSALMDAINNKINIHDKLKTIRESKVGKCIPTEFKGLNVFNMLKISISMMLFVDVSVFLLVSAKSSFSSNVVLGAAKYVFVPAALVGDSISILASFFYQELIVLIAVIPLKIVKVVAEAIIISFNLPIAILHLSVAVAFMLASLSIDFLVVYYFGVYTSILESGNEKELDKFKADANGEI